MQRSIPIKNVDPDWHESQAAEAEASGYDVIASYHDDRTKELKREERKGDAQKAVETLLVQNLDKLFPTAEDLAKFPLYRFDPNTGEKERVYEDLGQQSDGTFKLVLSVDEGYIESIRQEAEANSMTAEQWCSQQFNFFLESWWAKPKGR